MIDLKIGGVPEHFNLAWYLTLKDGAYKKKGINLRWQDYFGGTGQMCQALRNKEIDLAVILTEGIITDIIAGNQSKIVQTFVQTPLIWGIHVSGQAPFNQISDLRGKKAAISRYGSGSHLMAYLNAEKQGWNLATDLKFEVVRNLDGAIEGLQNEQADYFMWEKFTTKPLVDNRIFKRIGEFLTPWPCFVIAARNEVIEEQHDSLKEILDIINETTLEFKYIPSIDRTISNRYNQSLEDVQHWLQLTEWSQDIMDAEQIDGIQDHLRKLEIIPKKVTYSELIHTL